MEHCSSASQQHTVILSLLQLVTWMGSEPATFKSCKNGYHRTVEQGQIKIKSLKRKYKDIVDREWRSSTGNKPDKKNLGHPARTHSTSRKTLADDEADQPKKREANHPQCTSREGRKCDDIGAVCCTWRSKEGQNEMWEKRCEIEDKRDKTAAANDQQLMLSVTGQMMGTQYIGASFTPYTPFQLPGSPMPLFSAGYPPITQPFEPIREWGRIWQVLWTNSAVFSWLNRRTCTF